MVPVEEEQKQKYGRIHFIDLVRFYWGRRYTAIAWMIIFLAFGLIFAFFSQEEYQTSVSIVPEYELPQQINNMLESYGLILGLSQEHERPTDLLRNYPYIVQSASFKQALMYEPFYYQPVDSTITLYQYFTEIYTPSVLQVVYNYTIGLPQTMGRSFEAKHDAEYSKNKGLEQDTLFQIIHLSSTEKQVIQKLQMRMTAQFKPRAGMVRIQAHMPEPVLAAKLVQLTLKVLKQQVGQYKTQKAQIYKSFLSKQLVKAELKLSEARNELRSFKGSASQPLNKRMALQTQYNVALDHYHTINWLLRRTKLVIKEQLPAFRVLDDITIPSHRNAPQRSMIIILSILLGLFGAICWITVLYLMRLVKGKVS